MKTLTEIQQFSLYPMLIVVAVILTVAIFLYLKGKRNLMVFLGLGGGVIVVVGLFLFMKLTTTFDAVSARASFGFFEANIPWAKVKTVELKTYNPLFTGYGIRYSISPKRKIYNAQGNVGLLIDGEENYMIGVKSTDDMKLYLVELGKLYPDLDIKVSL